MKRLIILVFILGLAFLGYQYYRTNYAQSSVLPPSRLKITQSPLQFDSLTNVLGAATNSVVTTGKNLLNQASNGQAEPLINQTLDNLQREVKDLPREQYEKVKYEFCQDVIDNYQSSQENTPQQSPQ